MSKPDKPGKPRRGSRFTPPLDPADGDACRRKLKAACYRLSHKLRDRIKLADLLASPDPASFLAGRLAASGPPIRGDAVRLVNKVLRLLDWKARHHGKTQNGETGSGKALDR